MSKKTARDGETKKTAPKKKLGVNWVAVWVGFSIYLMGQDRILGTISLLASIYVLYRQHKAEQQQ